MKNILLSPVDPSHLNLPAGMPDAPTGAPKVVFTEGPAGRCLLEVHLPDGRTVVSPLGYAAFARTPDLLEQIWDAANTMVYQGTGLRLHPAAPMVVSTENTTTATVEGPVALGGITVGVYRLHVVTRGEMRGSFEVTLDGHKPAVVGTLAETPDGPVFAHHPTWI